MRGNESVVGGRAGGREKSEGWLGEDVCDSKIITLFERDERDEKDEKERERGMMFGEQKIRKRRREEKREKKKVEEEEENGRVDNQQ